MTKLQQIIVGVVILVAGGLLVVNALISKSFSVVPQPVPLAQSLAPVVPAGPFTFTQKMSEKDADNFTPGMAQRLLPNIIKGSVLTFRAVPFDKYALFWMILGDDYSRRLTDQQIKDNYIMNLANNLSAGKEVGVMVFLALNDKYNTTYDTTFDNTFYQYFFLENEQGAYIKATRSDPFTETNGDLNMINPSINTQIYFKQSDIDTLMANSKHLYLTFKGLNVASDPDGNRLEFGYPFVNSYSNYPALVSMVKEMENS